jgi:deoxyribonuclease-4
VSLSFSSCSAVFFHTGSEVVLKLPGKNVPLTGAHVSAAGGVHLAPVRGWDIGCATIQLFTRSNLRWRARPVSAAESEKFKNNLRLSGINPAFAHTCYLINPASPDSVIYKKSCAALLEELKRCTSLGLPFLVMHPGSHMGAGEKRAIANVGAALNRAFRLTPKSAVRVLLETTSGQGRSIGGRFEHIAAIVEAVEDKSRVGACIDTCHIFAAGFDIRTKASYRATMREFDSVVGLERVFAFHLNDSRTPLGSFVDRHEHIGRGYIGKEAFRFLLRDERFRNLPKVLETPKGKGYYWDRRNLALLRRLAE